jgi:hypothetical protein
VSTDKRSVSTDALETLGKLIDENQKRDAIHLAVEPVIAGERLQPGEHITVANGIAMSTEVGKGLGIVDPFLSNAIQKGQRFWFVMYPRMVHSLRHVWTHPAFADDRGAETVAPPSEAESEKWLRNFIATADCPDFETVIAAATGQPLDDVDGYGSAYNNDGEYLFFSGRDAHSDIPPVFWDHIENYTGIKIPNNLRAKSFSCSC